eukprot:sb/3471405/
MLFRRQQIKHSQVSATATIERKHTTEGSFSRLTRPYLVHPTSTKQVDLPPPCPLTSGLVTTLRESDSPYIPSRGPADPDSSAEVVFLTKGELDTAEQRARERMGRCEDGDMAVRSVTEVKNDTTRDAGLCWLYEGDVTFVDCSSSTSNKVLITQSYLHFKHSTHLSNMVLLTHIVTYIFNHSSI